VSKSSGLGRGLGSLIPTDQADENTSTFREIAVASVETNRFQPREHFDEEQMDSLAASVQELGVLQPILVREAGNGTYELIAGERRWRAARRAGLAVIPAIVRDATDVASLEQAVVENLHRQDLNALEEAAAYRQHIDDFSLTQEQVAQRVGKSRSAVTNTLRLLHLSTPVQRLIADGQLTAGHARALLARESREEQELLAQRVVDEHLSVREIEALVKDVPAAPTPAVTPSAPPVPDAAVLELEHLLSARLDTRVKVKMGKPGKVSIDFADIADLERIYRIIG
jgi:ParB family chromosome partitioning protein